MNPDDASKSLKKLVAVLRKAHPDTSAETGAHLAAAAPEGVDPGVHELLYGLLLWDASAEHAAAALVTIYEEVADPNELRVCLVSEMVSFIGQRYPDAVARCAAIKSALNGLYALHNEVTLAPLREMPKRAARAALDGLPGVPPFAAARVALLHLDAHAFPVDDRILAVLNTEHLCEDDGADKAGSRMERLVKAEDARDVYALVEAASSVMPVPVRGRSRSGARRPTTRKKSKATGE